MLTALRHLPGLREPEAAGPWLRQIARNLCRMRLRRRDPLPVADPEPLLPPTGEPRPDEALEQSYARD
jgi:DNA-directed RNA polymerase specialized sigma24 family protein